MALITVNDKYRPKSMQQRIETSVSSLLPVNTKIKWVIIGSGNSLLPGRCQDIVYTHAYPLSIRPLEIPLKNFQGQIKNMHLEMSAKCF